MPKTSNHDRSITRGLAHKQVATKNSFGGLRVRSLGGRSIACHRLTGGGEREVKQDRLDEASGEAPCMYIYIRTIIKTGSNTPLGRGPGEFWGSGGSLLELFFHIVKFKGLRPCADLFSGLCHDGDHNVEFKACLFDAAFDISCASGEDLRGGSPHRYLIYVCMYIYPSVYTWVQSLAHICSSVQLC